jgi:uncharacterized membrane protein
MTSTPAPAPAQRVSLLPTAAVGAAFLVVALVFVVPSSWYLAFKAVHVVFAVVWIGGGLLLTTLGLIAERQGDPAGKTAVARQAALVGDKVFTPSSLLVLASGIAMMLNDTGDLAWDWESFWVVFGLLGFASTFTIGIGILSPMAKKVRGLMQTVGPDAPETQAAISQILLVARVDVAVLMLVVVDMVAKPFIT